MVLVRSIIPLDCLIACHRVHTILSRRTYPPSSIVCTLFKQQMRIIVIGLLIVTEKCRWKLVVSLPLLCLLCFLERTCYTAIPAPLHFCRTWSAPMATEYLDGVPGSRLIPCLSHIPWLGDISPLPYANTEPPLCFLPLAWLDPTTTPSHRHHVKAAHTPRQVIVGNCSF